LPCYTAERLTPNLDKWLKSGLPWTSSDQQYFVKDKTNIEILEHWAYASKEFIFDFLEAIDWVDNNPDVDLSEYKAKKQTYQDVVLYNKILRVELKLLLELRNNQ